MKTSGSGPKSQDVTPVLVSAVARADRVARTFGRSWRCSAARSLPEATTLVPSSTRNVIRRCGGSLSRSNASGGTRTPRSRSSSRDMVSLMSAPGGAPSSLARISRATFGAGTSSRRTFFGSERISSVTSSSRRPGTCQENSSGRAWLSVLSGMSMVTPSDSLPGSNA